LYESTSSRTYIRTTISSWTEKDQEKQTSCVYDKLKLLSAEESALKQLFAQDEVKTQT
jgi:hypothetical protein